MVSYLLDTNVISELRKSQPHGTVRNWFNDISEDDIFLSTLTIGEIRYGIENIKQSKPAKAQELESWLIQLKQVYQSHIIPISQEIAEAWGHFLKIDVNNTIDSLLAATAQVERLTIVTRNIKDFSPYSVPLFNPWQDR